MPHSTNPAFSIAQRTTIALAVTALIILPGSIVQAQLRIVTYNTTHGPASGMATILKSIGEETRNGFAKPIDILLLQEQSNPSPGGNATNASPDTANFVNLLNNTIYNTTPGVTYAMSNRTGFGDTTQTLIYRVETVQVIAHSAVGSTSSSGAPRQPTRFQVRPVGYGSNADFYIYNSHYKANQGTDSGASTSNATRRNNEAAMLRANSDALPEGTHILYVGDHNFYDYDADEPAWATLMASGPGQAHDPINQVGTWHNNSSYAPYHTQSPCTSSVGNCGAGGGMDDRFDFQLVSGEMQDSLGLSIIPGSYHAFGNNGSTFNKNINDGCTTSLLCTNTVTFPGVTASKKDVLDALRIATDHLPVIADYQVPAVMQAVAGTIPSSIDLGTTFDLNITVSNAANVVASIGADLLRYSLVANGSASGSYANQTDAALGGPNIHSISLTTSSIGMKMATVTATSTSQGVQNGTINIPLNFLVVLPGDYNGDGAVDAADYVVWRRNSGLTGGATYTDGDGNRDGNVTIADYDIWRSHFGQTAAGFGAALATAVPEPATWMLAAMSICLASRRPTRLKRWTPQS